MNTDAEERFKESWEIISGQKKFENLDKGVKLKKKNLEVFFIKFYKLFMAKMEWMQKKSERRVWHVP